MAGHVAPSRDQNLRSHHLGQTRNAAGPSKSPPKSQGSSFNESITSQNAALQPGSADAQDASHTMPLQGAVTPATSLSNNSSQERAAEARREYRRGMLLDEGGFDTNEDPYRQAPPITDHGQSSSNKHTSAPKRMANGEVKSSKNSLPTSPTDSSLHGHSRNSSLASKGSHIPELSSQLRTRLSYAMVKVQHGWQNNNINELELFTSQQGSPISAVSNKRRAYEGSIGTISPIDDSGLPRLTEPTRTLSSPQHLQTSPQHSVAAHRISYPDLSVGGLANPAPFTQASTYESFWREHSSGTAPRPLHKSTGGPSLAPPANIQSRNPHRSGSSKKPPLLYTNSLSPPPSTPPSKPLTKIRTPSQQAAVEKDAVETLLFMSSPGNSGYHHHGLLPGTPFRSHLIPEERTPDQTLRGHSMRPGVTKPSSALPTGLQPTKSMTDGDIDRMLDEMSSDDELDDDDDDVMADRRAVGEIS